MGAEIAGEIGAARRNGGDRLTQLISHAALGCAMGAGLKSGGCASGAIGGVVGELTAEAYLAKRLEQGLTIADIDQLQGAGVNWSRLAAGLAAAAAGEDVNVAANTGGNAAENNALDAIWDTLSILYDAGKIAYGYYTDDKGLVKEGFIDLSADGVALLVPGLLAGSTKITRISANGAKKLDDALDAKTAIKTVEETGAKVVGGVGDTVKGGTVLGKYPEYLDLASELNAKRFDIPDDIWKNMTNSERWAANVKFLDRTIARGDTITLSNRVTDLDTVTGSFRKEWDYLIENGYSLSPDGLRMIK